MVEVPPRRLIGVLGGMGPAATVDFLAKLVAATPASRDQEHVPVIVHDVPQIPDRSHAIATGSDAPFLPMLAGVRMLERAGADAIVIPCNTAHHWHERLARASTVEIIHIADAVRTELADRPGPVRGLALMATSGTVRARIYQDRLGDVVSIIMPDEAIQVWIDGAIAAVKGGDPLRGARFAREAGEALLAQDAADALLLACTELPIALQGSGLTDRCIDATGALARACVAASLAQPSPAAVRSAAHGGPGWTYAGFRIS